MNIRKTFSAAGLVAAVSLFSATGNAADVLCQDPLLNHMLVDDAYVSACLDAGVGNLTGNPANDLFINGAGAGYSFIEQAGFTQDAGGCASAGASCTGSFSLDANLWNMFSQIAIGFKFGTGNEPDEWFVYSLQSGVTSGLWEFVNVFGKGGGLSHVNLYGKDGVEVPEPSSLALFGLALVALGVGRRLRKA